MNCIIWNVKGLNDHLKQMEVIARIRKLNINFTCLLGTQVKQNKIEDIIKMRFPGLSVLYNYSVAYNGRI